MGSGWRGLGVRLGLGWLIGLAMVGAAAGCSSTAPEADGGHRDRSSAVNGDRVDPFDTDGGDAGTGNLTGVWAIKATIKAKALVLGMDKDVTSVLLLRSEFDETSDGQVMLSTVVCDFALPQIPGFEAKLVAPPELLEKIGTLTTTAQRSGRMFLGARQVVTIGVVLQDALNDPLPMAPMTPEAAACGDTAPGHYCDQEGDGKTGGTLRFEPPFSVPGLIKLSKVYAGARAAADLSGTVGADSNFISGDISPDTIKLDTQVLGCETCATDMSADCNGPMDCTDMQAATVAALNPVPRPQDGSSFLAVRTIPPLDCPDIIDQAGALFR